MNRRRLLSTAAALSTPLITGCGDGGDGGNGGNDGNGGGGEDVADETVTIADESFVPIRLDVEGIHEYHRSVHGAQSICGVVLAGDVSLDGNKPCE
jgi:hypothetical protein